MGHVMTFFFLIKLFLFEKRVLLCENVCNNLYLLFLFFFEYRLWSEGDGFFLTYGGLSLGRQEQGEDAASKGLKLKEEIEKKGQGLSLDICKSFVESL